MQFLLDFTAHLIRKVVVVPETLITVWYTRREVEMAGKAI